mmetsp:Transcript_121754/g.339651  ORF Transcript_121754/g.339651 Transcript_121754/m.339651 type:complete len:212 (+) Transcript_121754:39-674(+)
MWKLFVLSLLAGACAVRQRGDLLDEDIVEEEFVADLNQPAGICQRVAEELYAAAQTDDRRFMTRVSCLRASIQARRDHGINCSYAYVCEGLGGAELGLQSTFRKCWERKLLAVGTCVDVAADGAGPGKEPFVPEPEDEVPEDEEAAKTFINAEAEKEEDDDIQLKKAPPEEPWKRVCCKVCKKQACGRSCISTSYTCWKEPGCACQAPAGP